MKKYFTSLLIVFSFIFFNASAISQTNEFLVEVPDSPKPTWTCTCQALRPGVDNNRFQKLCSYTCDCSIPSQVSNKRFESLPLPTSAVSFDDWDRGNLICHGQYAYKPSLASPVWMTEVRFTRFSINPTGETTHPEKVEVSANIYQYLAFSHLASEISQWLNSKIDATIEP